LIKKNVPILHNELQAGPPSNNEKTPKQDKKKNSSNE
jgi:hypothetical protein